MRPEARVVAERALVEAERALRFQNLRDRVAGVAVPRLAGGLIVQSCSHDVRRVAEEYRCPCGRRGTKTVGQGALETYQGAPPLELVVARQLRPGPEHAAHDGRAEARRRERPPALFMRDAP